MASFTSVRAQLVEAGRKYYIGDRQTQYVDYKNMYTDMDNAVMAVVKPVKQELADSQAKVQTLQGQVNALQEQVTTSTTRMQELEHVTTASTARIQALEQDVTASALREGALQQEVASSAARERALQREVERATTRKQALEQEVSRLKSLGLAAQLEQETKEAENKELSPLQFYDVIIDMSQLDDIYRGGWPICFLDPAKFQQFTSGVNCLSVSITGDFNVGKSWILSMLSGQTFQSGDRVHTQGISVKLVNIDAQAAEKGKKVFYIDTQGLNSPVMPRDEDHPELSQAVRLERSLQEMKALEEFQRQAVLSVSDVFIFVVGQLSAKNQLDLHLLFNAIKDLRRKSSADQVPEQRVFIIHNLRDWSHSQLVAEDYINRIQKVHGQGLTKLKFGNMEYLQGYDRTRSTIIRFEHLFLTRNTQTDCLNEETFNYIRTVIRGTQLLEVSLGDRLGHQMHRFLPSFLQVADRASHPKLKIVSKEAGEGDLRLSKLLRAGDAVGFYVPDMELPEEGITTTVRTRSLGSMVSLASDDLAYNMCEIPCTVVIDEDENLVMLRVMTVELPGLVCEDFSCLVYPRSDGDATASLVVINKRGRKGPEAKDGVVAEIHLRATLECYPKVMNSTKENQDVLAPKDVFQGKKEEKIHKTMALFKKFALSSRERIKNLDQFVCKVVDKGTRSLEQGRSSRDVNFKIELSEEDLPDWDPTMAVYTCYSKGVLAIGFVQRCKELEEEEVEPFRLRRQEPEAESEE